ncbi:hypothetical protein BC629DRAFT_1536984 [Irpex lacteus]|nr:hypothetical protein BC629DRAFT_1536984 [Irpex lacteus]
MQGGSVAGGAKLAERRIFASFGILAPFSIAEALITVFPRTCQWPWSDIYRNHSKKKLGVQSGNFCCSHQSYSRLEKVP